MPLHEIKRDMRSAKHRGDWEKCLEQLQEFRNDPSTSKEDKASATSCLLSCLYYLGNWEEAHKLANEVADAIEKVGPPFQGNIDPSALSANLLVELNVKQSAIYRGMAGQDALSHDRNSLLESAQRHLSHAQTTLGNLEGDIGRLHNLVQYNRARFCAELVRHGKDTAEAEMLVTLINKYIENLTTSGDAPCTEAQPSGEHSPFASVSNENLEWLLRAEALSFSVVHGDGSHILPFSPEKVHDMNHCMSYLSNEYKSVSTRTCAVLVESASRYLAFHAHQLGKADEKVLRNICTICDNHTELCTELLGKNICSNLAKVREKLPKTSATVSTQLVSSEGSTVSTERVNRDSPSMSN